MSANIHDHFADAGKAETLEPIRSFLDTAASVPEIEDYKRRIRAHLAVQPGETFLDVGCGMGHEVCHVASSVQGAIAIGLDREAVIHEAAARAADLGLEARWIAGDAEAIPLPDASVDACMTERVLKYLPEPDRAVGEIARILKPDGRFASFELDYDATVLCGDPEATGPIIGVLRESVGFPRMGRQLPELLRELGMADLGCRPVAFTPPWEIQMAIVRDTVQDAIAAGRLPRDLGDEWLRVHASAYQSGCFTVAFVGCLVTARKPA